MIDFFEMWALWYVALLALIGFCWGMSRVFGPGWGWGLYAAYRISRRK